MSAIVMLPDSIPQARASLSLRMKGMLMLATLVVYGVLAAWFIASQRQALFITAQQIDSHHAAQELLTPTFATLAHTLVQVQSILNGPAYSEGVHATYADIGGSLDPLMQRLDPVREFDSTLAPYIDALQSAVDGVRAVPSGANLTAVRDAEQEMIAHLNDVLGALQHRTEVLGQKYHDQQQLLSITAVGTSIGGALATAAVILVFFTQLAKDLERLRARAVAIVSGYAGEPLVNGRSDEVGVLIDAVNRMQVDLRRWEQQVEINRQQRFHQEKMAAVGSMAAAIGHEVSNPIAAIAGVAQYLIAETKDDPSRNSQLAHDFSVQILRQTERISLIMRQLAGLTRTHSPDPELLDLNSLAQSTGGFISFDKRFRGIEIEYRFDHDLPAVLAVTDHITQVLMNLLINAADAMEETAERRAPRIVIATRVVGGEVCLDVTDTGHGMTPEVLARAFDESFTTKPAGRGRGIGLFLCKTLMTQAGGRIEATSTPDVGTTMTLVIPPAPRDVARG